jgi:putative endonuclease
MRPLLSLLELSDSLRHWARKDRLVSTLASGLRGEDLAHRFLQRAGLRVVARNHRGFGGGEVDIIAWDGSTLAFVEVKSRATDEFGDPERAIGGLKQALLRRAAHDYCRTANLPISIVRFDVVAIVFGPPFSIEYRRDTFSLREPVA